MILNADGEMWSPPIWADLARTDWDGRLRLDLPGTFRDLERHRLVLRDGLKLVVFDRDGTEVADVDDIIAVGVVQYDDAEGHWVLDEWRDAFHFSDMDASSQGVY